ncbi:MAG: 3-hydroxyacyl-ACP dehydratase FabZ, partial [Rickettsiales bacterium]|nr:3-hydroxyacyl-ACP dehydratase FabZ [Rickettsiales bacterium]
NEQVFTGHFPGKPVMPGVLIVEAMAQTSAVLVVETLGKASEGKLVYFMSVDEARFRKPVVPGDSLHIRAEKMQSRRNVWKFSCVATVDGQRVADAIICAMIVD